MSVNVMYFVLLLIFGALCMISGYSIGKSHATSEILKALVDKIGPSKDEQ